MAVFYNKQVNFLCVFISVKKEIFFDATDIKARKIFG